MGPFAPFVSRQVFGGTVSLSEAQHCRVCGPIHWELSPFEPADWCLDRTFRLNRRRGCRSDRFLHHRGSIGSWRETRPRRGKGETLPREYAIWPRPAGIRRLTCAPGHPRPGRPWARSSPRCETSNRFRALSGRRDPGTRENCRRRVGKPRDGPIAEVGRRSDDRLVERLWILIDQRLKPILTPSLGSSQVLNRHVVCSESCFSVELKHAIA